MGGREERQELTGWIRVDTLPRLDRQQEIALTPEGRKCSPSEAFSGCCQTIRQVKTYESTTSTSPSLTGSRPAHPERIAHDS